MANRRNLVIVSNSIGLRIQDELKPTHDGSHSGAKFWKSTKGGPELKNCLGESLHKKEIKYILLVSPFLLDIANTEGDQLKNLPARVKNIIKNAKEIAEEEGKKIFLIESPIMKRRGLRDYEFGRAIQYRSKIIADIQQDIKKQAEADDWGTLKWINIRWEDQDIRWDGYHPTQMGVAEMIRKFKEVLKEEGCEWKEEKA